MNLIHRKGAKAQRTRRKQYVKQLVPLTSWVGGMGNQKNAGPVIFFAKLCVLCAFAVRPLA
jgi:hypothetical protein